MILKIRITGEKISSKASKEMQMMNKAAVEITNLLDITISETGKASEMVRKLVPEII